MDSMTLGTIIIVLVGASMGLLVYGVLNNPDKFQQKRIIRDMYVNKDINTLYDRALTSRKGKKKISEYIHVSKQFENEIASADLPVSPSEFLIIWVGAVLIPAFLSIIITRNAIVGTGLAIIGFLAPLIIYKKKKADKQKKFSAQLGDALITMCNGLKSGFSFQQAMRSVAKDMTPPLSTEFMRALNEMDYGISQHDALYRMYERMRNEDLKMMISALAISQKTGGNLSDVLETCSNTVKNRIRIRQEVNAMSAQGKMSSLIVGGLPVAIACLLMVTNPSYISTLIETSMGKGMLVGAVIMEGLGFFLMNKITDIKL